MTVITLPSAGDNLAELRLHEPKPNLTLCCRLSGPAHLVAAVASVITRLLACPHPPDRLLCLYLTLFELSDETGRCRVYQDQLAALVSVSTRHLRRLLGHLETAGLVQIRRYPRPQPSGYFLPLLSALQESASLLQADPALSAIEEGVGPREESAMSHEHDDALPNKTKQPLLFLHEGQRQERLAQPHCTPAFLQAWDDWWVVGRFGRLRNPAGWANLRIKQGRWPPVVPTPLPQLATLPGEYQAETPTAEAALWADVLAQLSRQLTQATFDTWLKETRLAARTGERFRIVVRSGFARDWLENRLSAVIKRAIAQTTDIPADRLELVFRVGSP